MAHAPSPNTATVSEHSEGEVLKTVYSFDHFRIVKYLYRDNTLLECGGVFSPVMLRELDKLASQARGNLGLDMGSVTGLQPALLMPLKAVQKRLQQRGKGFVLCNPPQRLLDLIKLNSLEDHFQIEDSAARQSPAPSVKPAPREAPERPASATGSQVIAKREIAHLSQSLRRTEVLERGLDSASRCVRRFLPAAAPEIPGWDFAFSCTPCDKVGGDFFDFIPTSARGLDLSIGDVSGHGLDSAIIMAMAKKVVRLRARESTGSSPAALLAKVNEDLYEDLGRKFFITALHASLDLDTGVVTFARAGHEPPIHFLPGGGHAVPIPSGGMAMGMGRGRLFRSAIGDGKVVLSPGEGLLLCTDGLVETANERKDLFSRERLLYVLERIPAATGARGVLERIHRAAESFSGGIAPEDDVTVIVIVRN